MKTLFKSIVILSILFQIRCSNDDNANIEQIEIEEELPAVEVSLIGSWEASNFLLGDSTIFNAFFIIESENIFLLEEDENSFRREFIGTYEATEDSIFITSEGGITQLTYTLDANTLSIIDSFDQETLFSRQETPINPNSWITDLEISLQVEAPHNESVDIGHCNNLIFFPNGNSAPSISLIGDDTFTTLGIFNSATTENTTAFEVENNNSTFNFMFIGEQFGDIDVKFKNDNTPVGEITEFIPDYLGLASVNSSLLFISHDFGFSFSLYNYFTGVAVYTNTSLPRLEGMAYKNDYLYVCSNGNIYKCEASLTDSELVVIESYSLPDNLEAVGIAYDEEFFVINAEDPSSGTFYIIRTNLTLED